MEVATQDGPQGAQVALDGAPIDAAAGPAAPPVQRSVLEIGIACGTTMEVMTGYLTALGIEGTVAPDLFLDFDPDDLTEARRSFAVEVAGTSAQATPLQKASVTQWIRHITAAIGPRAPSLLDANFVPPVAAPAPARLPSAPAAPTELPLSDHSRSAGPPAPLTATATGAARHPAFGVASFVPAAAKAGAASPLPPLRGPGPPPLPTGAVAMRDFVDQTHAGVFYPLSDDEVEDAWAVHFRMTGLKPRADSEPSPEQLGALRALLQSGGAPCVDFALWGPHDRRHAKDRRAMALVWVEAAPGQPALQPRMLTGPDSYEIWVKHWEVFEAAMLSLAACAPGPLARYQTGIRDLHLVFPHLWGVIARADEAMRFEQWRRMASEAPPQGDWSHIIAASAYGEDGARQWWWYKHVSQPAGQDKPHTVLNALEGYTPRGASLLPVQVSAAAQASGYTDDRAGAAQPPWKRRRGGAPGNAQPAAPVTPPPPAVAAAAAAAPPLRNAPPGKGKKGSCFEFNAGRCTSVDDPCPLGYTHKCVVCGQRHSAQTVPRCRAKTDANGRMTKGAGRGK